MRKKEEQMRKKEVKEEKKRKWEEKRNGRQGDAWAPRKRKGAQVP